MRLTRDSMVWWLGIISSIVLYLSNADTPTEWTWPEWMQAVSFVVGVVSAKLATSPLKGADNAGK